MRSWIYAVAPGVLLVPPEGFGGASRAQRSMGARCLCYGGGGADPPPPRDLYQETSDELKAKVDLAGPMLAAERLYRPQYQSLDLQNLQDLINGTSAGKRTETYTEMEQVPATYKYVNDGSRYGHQVVDQPAYQRPVLKTREVDAPAQRGLLDIFQNDIMPRYNDITSQSREAEIADVAKLGPSALAAFRAANPEQAALMSRLNSDAMSELDAGASLDPAMAREVAQGVRGAQSARGMGMGLNDMVQEAMARGSAGNALRQQRRANAAGMVQLNQATGMDPYMSILGRPSQALQGANSAVGTGLSQGKTLGPELFGGSNINAGDLFNTNYNAQAAANISNANSSAAMTSAGIGAGGAVLGGVLLAL